MSMKTSNCRGNQLSRRNFLAAGCAAGLGLNLAQLLKWQSVEAATAKTFGGSPKARGVIHIFLPGGVAQQESFDPKPFAPIEYRGDLGKVRTKTGEFFSSTLKRVAQVADRLTVIRSMTHTEAAHERGTHTMFTGYQPSPAIIYPSIGSVVSHELGMRNHLPPYVCIPEEPKEFAGAGYLSSAYGPFSLGSDPARSDFKVKDLEAPADVNEQRAARRRKALSQVDQHFDTLTNDDGVEAMNTFYERAFSLLDSRVAREAFNIKAESGQIRNKYGRNQAGQRLLMARRLVEAGVRLVTLTYGAWDNHQRLSQNFRRQMPAFDQALATLIEDLDDRGMLDETIVLVTTEFGRTPKFNADAGRDHWPRVFSIAAAGGGFARGLTYGASNATAAEPEIDPVSPADLMATIYHQLGINPDKKLLAMGNRPIDIVKDGRVIDALIS